MTIIVLHVPNHKVFVIRVKVVISFIRTNVTTHVHLRQWLWKQFVLIVIQLVLHARQLLMLVIVVQKEIYSTIKNAIILVQVILSNPEQPVLIVIQNALHALIHQVIAIVALMDTS